MCRKLQNLKQFFHFLNIIIIVNGNKMPNTSNRNHLSVTDAFSKATYLHWFPPQDEEVLCSHHHKAHELVAQNLLNLIGLEQIC